MRYYVINEKKYPSVTTILGIFKEHNTALQRWKERTVNYEELLHYYALRGTLAHSIVSDKLESMGGVTNAFPSTPKTEDIKNTLRSVGKTMKDLMDDLFVASMKFDQFMRDHNVIPLYSEYVIWSDRYGYAGQVDQVVVLDGRLTIIDVKTSRQAYETYGYQMSAYLEALRERVPNENWDEARRMILLLSPDVNDTYEMVFFGDHEHDFKMFLRALTVFKRRARDGWYANEDTSYRVIE